jgi:CRISPR-associated protein Cas5d
MTFGVKLKVSGPRACFSRPELKTERMSYDCMSPSAARGVLEAIHWKPAIVWRIDKIHVLKPIRFQSLRRNEVGHKIPVGNVKKAMKTGAVHLLRQRADHDRQQRAATILVDVAYVIEAHFEMTAKAGPDDTPAKHYEMFTRRARIGQCFHQPCLGTREFAADFELVEGDPPAHALPDDQQNLRLGLMLLDIDHADDRTPLFFDARLQNGVLKVPPLHSREVRS